MNSENSLSDLHALLNDIQLKTKNGINNFNLLLSMLQKRFDANTKYYKFLQKAIPDNFDPKDEVLVNIADQIKKEIEFQKKYTYQVHEKIINELKVFQVTLLSQKKKYYSSLKKEKSKIGTKIKGKTPKKRRRFSFVSKNEKHLMNKAPNENQIEENLEKQISSFNNYLGNFESFRCMKMKEYYKKYIDMTITHYQQFINDFNQYITGNEIIYSEIIKQKISENEKYVYAISNYKSKEPSDLCFKRGTKIKLLKKNENGWWEGELKNGKVGLFPSTYVFFKEDNSKTYIGETFLLMENFKPQNSQEIKIETGDFVQVKFITSTQGYGMNLMTKKEGFFPLSLIDVVPDDDEDK